MTPKPILGVRLINRQAQDVNEELANGTFSFHSGDMPDDMEREPPADSLLARGFFSPVPFSKPRDGVIRANKAERVQAIRSGDPKFVRCCGPNGDLVFAGTCGVRPKEEDKEQEVPNFVTNAKTMVEGQFIDITGMTYAVPRTF